MPVRSTPATTSSAVGGDSEFPVSIGAGVSVGHNAQVYQRLIDLHRDANDS